MTQKVDLVCATDLSREHCVSRTIQDRDVSFLKLRSKARAGIRLTRLETLAFDRSKSTRLVGGLESYFMLLGRLDSWDLFSAIWGLVMNGSCRECHLQPL